MLEGVLRIVKVIIHEQGYVEYITHLLLDFKILILRSAIIISRP